MFVVFFFSAVIHEMLISVSTTTYYVFFNNVCPFAACLIILDLRHCDNILLDSIPHDSLLQLSWNDEVSQSYAMNRYQRKSSCYLLHYSQRINNFSHSQIPLVMITKYIDKVRPGSRWDDANVCIPIFEIHTATHSCAHSCVICTYYINTTLLPY